LWLLKSSDKNHLPGSYTEYLNENYSALNLCSSRVNTAMSHDVSDDVIVVISIVDVINVFRHLVLHNATSTCGKLATILVNGSVGF